MFAMIFQIVWGFVVGIFGGWLAGRIWRRAPAAATVILSERETHRWIMQTLVKEYGVWRDAEDAEEGAEDELTREAIKIGAMGALANVIAKCVQQPPPYPHEPPVFPTVSQVQPEEKEIA